MRFPALSLDVIVEVSLPRTPYALKPLHLQNHSVLVRLETSPLPSHTRHRGPLAPGWIPLALGVALQDQEAHREKTDLQASSRSHLPHGDGEPHLGSSTHPRRTSHARF